MTLPASELKALVERLRSFDDPRIQWGVITISDAIVQIRRAASALEAMGAELERTESERKLCFEKYIDNRDQRIELRLQVEAKFKLGSYLNAAGINASDMPHMVVEKLQAAIDAALTPSGAE